MQLLWGQYSLVSQVVCIPQTMTFSQGNRLIFQHRIYIQSQKAEVFLVTPSCDIRIKTGIYKAMIQQLRFILSEHSPNEMIPVCLLQVFRQLSRLSNFSYKARFPKTNKLKGSKLSKQQTHNLQTHLLIYHSTSNPHKIIDIIYLTHASHNWIFFFLHQIPLWKLSK